MYFNKKPNDEAVTKVARQQQWSNTTQLWKQVYLKGLQWVKMTYLMVRMSLPISNL